MQRNCFCAILVAVVLSASPLARAADQAAGRVIPPGALAALRIDVPSLTQTKSFNFLAEVAARVSAEASQFSLGKLGVDATTLVEITVVAPPFEQFVVASSSDSAPVVFIATFADAFQIPAVVERLQSELELVAAENGSFTDGNELALFVASNHTLVAASPQGLAWWLEARRQNGPSQLTDALTAASQTPIVAAFDVAQVPRGFVEGMPTTLQALSESQVIAAGVDFDEKLTLNLVFRFGEESSAKSSAAGLESLIGQGKMMLSLGEMTLQQALSNPDTSAEEGMGALAGLAGVRQGRAYLETVVVEQEANAVRATAQVDNEVTSAVMVCLSAIRAIGVQAQNEFEAVSDQLGSR